jgi:hypothetical protein
MDLLDNLQIEEIIPAIVLGAAEYTMEGKEYHQTGLAGREYLRELLSSTDLRIYEVLRIKKETFFKLCDWLEANTKLKATWRSSIQEQVAMFLWTLNFGASIRQVKERFQHSQETIGR